MMTQNEILRRNRLIQESLAGNSDFHFGLLHVNINYLIYYPEASAACSPVHTHPYWELSILRSGEMEYHPANADSPPVVLKAPKKRYVMLPPHLKHYRKNDSKSLIFGFMLSLTGKTPELEKKLYEQTKQYGFLLKARSGRIGKLEKTLSRPASAAVRAETAMRIRLWLLEIFEDNFPGILKEEGDPEQLRRTIPLAENYIVENLGNPLNINRIAMVCGMSRRQLYRRFEKDFGMPVNQFILLRRLQYAAEELGSGRRPVKTIAREAGFNNMSYFARCFRKRYGVLPSLFTNR